ncbi:MAG: hypothetical protein IT454_18045, partial [Planctomycetes bacterium]|nr:hypothetical protein [Planctomycetota bacterium]
MPPLTGRSQSAWDFGSAPRDSVGRLASDLGVGPIDARANGFRGDILDEELVVLLKQAGMYRCMVAVESASPRIQKVMKK